MEALWFCIVAVMIAVYVVLDGFDLGAGIVHLWVARTEAERRQVLQSIGPFWDGNEVWLLAAGGTLYFAFPALYASSFSGFYLPLMIVLWLLILRGISIEFRSHLDSPIWKPLWDVLFAAASSFLSLFFGAALGNVIRGVPLDSKGEFFLPLWTDLGVDGDVGILDWYTISVGLLALLTLTQHGAFWVALKTFGPVETRAHRLAGLTWWAVAPMTALVTLLTMRVQPQVWANLTAHPGGLAFPGLAVAGLAAMVVFRRQRKPFKTFLASCAYVLGMLTSAAFGVFPYVLPSNRDRGLGLTIYNSAAAPYGLRIGLAWWIPGILLAAGYFTYIYRHFKGKVTVEGRGY